MLSYQGMGSDNPTYGYPAHATTEHWKMALENKGLAHGFLARHGILKTDERDELMAEVGWPALLRAAIQFDPTKGKFSTYANYKLWGHWSMRRKCGTGKVRPECSLEPALYVPEKPGACSEPDDADGLGSARRWLNLLEPRDQAIILLCVVEGLTCEAAAKIVGLKRANAWQRKKKAMAKLRHLAMHPTETK